MRRDWYPLRYVLDCLKEFECRCTEEDFNCYTIRRSHGQLRRGAAIWHLRERVYIRSILLLALLELGIEADEFEACVERREKGGLS